MTEQRTILLSRGELTLSYQTSHHYQLDDLLGFAERINPKRAFLFVSKVLGRHIPVSPAVMRQAFTDLANCLPNGLPEPILVVGMAETAVGLSAGVHQVLQQRYPQAILLNSTRHAQTQTPHHKQTENQTENQTGKLLAKFSEDHSHASEHLIYQSDDSELQHKVMTAKTLIMVDDEASTGKTCQNVVNALRHAGLTKLEQVHLATLVDWSLAKTQANPFSDIAFFRHHLLSGNWQWTDKPNPPTVSMPNVATTKAGSQPLLPTGNWGRQPTLDSRAGFASLLSSFEQRLAKSQLTIADFADKNILVLGSNEFVWLPFLLAEYLQQKCINVKFSALTRSPIATHPDSAVTTVIKFFDNYGLGMTNFVYNVVPSDWDLIVLCVETPSNSVDKIWAEFGNVMIASPASPMLNSM